MSENMADLVRERNRAATSQGSGPGPNHWNGQLRPVTFCT